MRYMQPPQPGTTPVPEVPDGVLVRQALTGDEHAFATLVDRYQDPLLGYIRSMLKDGEPTLYLFANAQYPNATPRVAVSGRT